jgi:hypothetical protein
MAIRFGQALERALRVSHGEMQLTQTGPERIFKVVSEASEAEFRDAMAMSGTSCPGKVLFEEL